MIRLIIIILLIILLSPIFMGLIYLALALLLLSLLLVIYVLLCIFVGYIIYPICCCGLIINSRQSDTRLRDSIFFYTIFGGIAFLVYSLYKINVVTWSDSLYLNILVYLFIFGFSFILTAYLVNLKFELLRKLNIKLSKKAKELIMYSIYVIEFLLASFTVIYSEIMQIWSLETAIIGTMTVLIPIAIITTIILGRYAYIRFVRKSRKVIKLKAKEGVSLTNVETKSDVYKTLQDVKSKPKKIHIEACTKEELMLLEVFDSEKATLIIKERDDGNIWYDIDSFVQHFSIQPHEMIEIIDIIVFPPKPSNKSGRRIDI